LGYGVCLGSSSPRQRKVGTTAKSFWLDAFYMPMTGEVNLCHVGPASMNVIPQASYAISENGL